MQQYLEYFIYFSPLKEQCTVRKGAGKGKQNNEGAEVTPFCGKIATLNTIILELQSWKSPYGPLSLTLVEQGQGGINLSTSGF